MTDFEQYKEHIEHTFNAYCKIVIRHAAINIARQRRKQQERTIEHPCAIGKDTVMLNSSLLAAALTHLPERKREMVYLRFFENCTYKEIGKRYP